MSELPPAQGVAAAAALPAAGAPVPLMVRRFRGFLPVVVDVETGGFQPSTDALLQMAAVLIEIEPNGRLHRGETHSYHVRPFEKSRLDPASLLVNKIDPWHPLRPAIDESDALQRIFRAVRAAVRGHGCRRAVLVGHNAAFDLAFLNAAVIRTIRGTPASFRRAHRAFCRQRRRQGRKRLVFLDMRCVGVRGAE